MAYPQTVDPILVPIPILGMNRRDPLASMDPRFAPWILNFEPEPQNLKARGGWVIHQEIPGDLHVWGLGAYGRDALFAWCDGGTDPNVIYDVTSTPSLVETCGGSASPGGINPIAFSGRLALVASTGSSDNSRVWDGSAWAAWGFTTGGSPLGVRWGVSHRGRLFMGGDSTYSLFYPDTIGAVTGAVSSVDLASLIDDSDIQQFEWGEVLSTPSNRGVEQLLVLGDSFGNILVYGGDYPAADNWEIVATFKLSVCPNSGRRGVLRFRNDIWILTLDGVISLRALMSYGADEWDKVSVSSAIDPYIQAVTRDSGGLSTSEGSIAYWPEQGKVFVLFPWARDADGVAVDDHCTMFVYNIHSQGWAVQQIPAPMNNLTYFNNGLYAACTLAVATGYSHLIMKYDSTVFKDEVIATPGTYQAIPYALHSAYMNLGTNKKKHVVGFEPIIKTDFTGASVTMKAAADFGRKVSAASSVGLLDGHQVPHYACGANGTFVQYRLEGNSDVDSEDGLELYSVGACIK